jgi:hydrogenase maturation protease
VVATQDRPTRTVLVAGIGNVFLADDGFGPRVVERLRQLGGCARPDVRVEDFGIRGIDLAYALMEPGTEAILVDATPRGGVPGTLYVLEIEAGGELHLDSHAIDPANVLRLVRALGGEPPRVLLVGVEPHTFEGDELSPPVEAALNEAVELVATLVQRLRA